MSGRRRTPPSAFGTSFLDLLACALGGLILIVLVLAQQAQQRLRELEQERDCARATARAADDALRREQGERASERLASAQAHARDRGRIDALSRELEAERRRGFVVPVPLAVRIDWDVRGIDVDLAVTGPGGATARYPAQQRNQTFGNLMRDEVQATNDTWEVFYSMDPPAGRYVVACSFYSAGPDVPVRVRGVVVLHPGDPARRVAKEFAVVLRPAHKYPLRSVAAFEITRGAAGCAITFGAFVQEPG